MIKPADFYKALSDADVGFFTGVPDSLLKNFCAYVTDNVSKQNHIIAANEGGSVGQAIGYHLATGKIPMVYMQNSGFGNIVNPILSLADKEVYSIPMLLLVGWRGQVGVKDEPQHVKQGRITSDLLDAMEIPYVNIGHSLGEAKAAIDEAMTYCREHSAPFALLVEKGAFDKYSMSIVREDLEMTRESAIDTIATLLPDDSIVVATTGMAARELFESRIKSDSGNYRDFLTVGGMGHALQIALGVALQSPKRKVVCIDGDGAAIMHLGGMTSIGSQAPTNLMHILINNGVHGSVGGQPTVGRNIDFKGIARACQYPTAISVNTHESLKSKIKGMLAKNHLSFLEINVKTGNRSDLGRPTATPLENKEGFMSFLQN